VVVVPLAAGGAVIQLAFDPILRIGDWSVRLETIALGLVLFLALVIAAAVARATPIDLSKPPDAPGDEPDELNRLRADDLLYIAVAALPGAVIGARIGYALIHLDYYGSNLAPLLDIGQGGFQLSLGVVGGVLTGSIVATLLGAPVGRWLHAATFPVLLAIAGGKAAMILGGSGQGLPSDAGWATAYLGPGPWGSLAPALPSNPSQAYEALATLAVVVVVMWALAFGAFPGRRGGAFLFAIGLWAIARALVATTWRDPAVVGPLRMDQVISIAIAAGSLALMTIIGGTAVLRDRRAPAVHSVQGGETVPATGSEKRQPGDPDWPDPASRPRI
jgi:prolipoprotein diacylglyceryltransferase